MFLWFFGFYFGFVLVFLVYVVVVKRFFIDLFSLWLRGNVFLDKVKIDFFLNMFIVVKKNK